MNLKELNQSTICAQPWFGATVKPNGVAGICCEITDELRDLNVNQHSFADFQNHPKIIEIKNEMLAGGKPSVCWRCWQKEDGGAPSLRHVLNHSYIEYNGSFDPNFVAPQNIEFVLGNLCQLRCVMCHPARSKKVEQVFEYVIKTDFRKSYKGLVEMLPSDFKTDWVEDEVLWDSLAEQAKTARRIYINGGEPMLAKEHIKVLNKLIDNGTAKDVSLLYSSNGMLIEDKHVALWSQFNTTSITFSLDDLGERNGFIRYPSDWGQVERALNRVVGWQDDPQNINIAWGIWCTISTLNFAYLPEFLRFFATKYPTIRINGWRGVQTPAYLDPSHLPQELKAQYASEIHATIDEFPQFNHLRSDIDLILNSPQDAQLLDDGLSFLKMNADVYGVDLKSTFPKLSHLL